MVKKILPGFVSEQAPSEILKDWERYKEIQESLLKSYSISVRVSDSFRFLEMNVWNLEK